MDSTVESLSTISEFSIGMAGFSGIVAVVVGTSRGWNDVSKFRAGNLIILSIIPGFSALTSLGLAQYISGDLLWQVSCGVQSLAAITYIAFNAKKSRGAFNHSIFSIRHPLNATLWIVYMVNSGLQLTGMFGALGRFGFAVFFGGLVLHLAIAALNFYRLVFPPEGDTSDA